MEGNNPLYVLKHTISISHIETRLVQQILLKILIWSVQSFMIWSRSLASATLFLQSIEWWQEFTSHHHKFPTGANKSSQLSYMWESAIFYSQSKSNMLPLLGAVINYVCIISGMELGRGGKTKPSNRGCIVSLETTGDAALLTADLLLTLSLAACVLNAFVSLSSAQDWNSNVFIWKSVFTSGHSFLVTFWYPSKEKNLLKSNFLEDLIFCIKSLIKYVVLAQLMP